MKRLLLCSMLLLTACTGTDDLPLTVRLAVLTDGGAALRVVTPTQAGQTGSGQTGSGASPVTQNAQLAVSGGVTLDSLPSGQRLALTRAAGIESLDADLGAPRAFEAPPFAAVCLTGTAASAGRDRLLTLSECPGGPQELALYRENGTLVWTARLPTFLPPTPGTDAPPVRLAVSGDVAVVSRPRGDDGGEVIRVAPLSPGNPLAVPGTPEPTAPIRDLAPYGTDLVAATDNGLRRLSATGVPQDTALAAFGTSRYNRVGSGTAGAGVYLAAWRGATAAQPGSAQPLLLWDGERDEAVPVATLNDVRDLTLVPDGTLSVLTASTLTRYDVALGLAQGNFRPQTLLSGLNDARSVTWLVPEVAGP